MFREIKANKLSTSGRRPIYGVGINDAAYKVTQVIKGKALACPYYRRWVNMLERCYNEKYLKRKPTYKDCSVCEEWLTFSNFKSWMMEQDWEGKFLDKDSIAEGNKTYSPETCCFMTNEENQQKTTKTREAKGYSWHKQNKKWAAQIKIKSKKRNLGYFDNEEEAHEAYLEARRQKDEGIL